MASGGTNSLYAGDGGFFYMASSVICWYEHAITFGEEVRCIWTRRISVASVLFLLNRYLTLISSIVSMVQLFPWRSLPEGFMYPYTEVLVEPHDEICSVSLHLLDACLIVTTLTYTVFAALRMFALCDLNKPTFAVVLIVGLLNPCVQICIMANEFVVTSLSAYNGILGPIGTRLPYGRTNCFHTVSSGAEKLPGHDYLPAGTLLFPALRVHALIFEAILIGLTWRKTRSQWNLQNTAVRTPFTTMLLRYGTLYFVIIAIASVLNVTGVMILWLLDGADETSKNATIPLLLARASPIVDALTSICMSRFILGLLGIAADKQRTVQWSSFQRNTLNFANMAQTIAGNMGGDLNDGLFADGTGEDLAETEDSEDNIGLEGDRPRMFGGRDAMG